MKTKIIILSLMLMANMNPAAAQEGRQDGGTADGPAQPALLDTDGKHVNAHGGCIIKHGSTWYWYGEARPERGFTSLGVSLYTCEIPAPAPGEPGMTDGGGMSYRPEFLTGKKWVNRGLVLEVVDSAGSPIERGCIIERPKVIYNYKTKKFVMLFHLELKGRGYEAAQVGFAVSDTPEGPFVFHHAQRPNPGVWPAGWTAEDIARARKHNPKAFGKGRTAAWMKAVRDGMYVARDLDGGQMSRDMTVYQDDHSRWWHVYASEENLTLQAAELTEDCLGYTGRYYRIAPGGQNEAPVLFKMDGKVWLVCSGCTGWEPNEARMFSADSISGEWTQHPSPMRGEGAERTFGAQGAWAVCEDDHVWFIADFWYPRSLANSCYFSTEVRPWDEALPTIPRY